MKANEILHGGLYFIHDVGDVIVRYDIITNTFKSEYYVYPLVVYGERVCAADEDRYIVVHPIPLTEKILMANGFTTDNDHTLKGSCIYRRLCGKYEDYKVIVRLLNGWVKIESFDDRWHTLLDLTIQPRYVHELQHVLRLCGLNDLADNFKIE